MNYNFKLKEQIKRKGFSQRQFAVKVGINEAYLSQIINGRVNPTPNEKTIISQTLKTPIKVLFDD